MEVSFVDATTRSSGSSENVEHFHLYDEKVESKNMSAGGTGNILSSLPKDVSQKVYHFSFNQLFSRASQHIGNV